MTLRQTTLLLLAIGIVDFLPNRGRAETSGPKSLGDSQTQTQSPQKPHSQSPSMSTAATSTNSQEQSHEQTHELPHESSQSESLLPEEILQMSQRADLPEHVFLVDKSLRVLQVFKRVDDSYKKVVEYPTDIGKNDGAKVRRNDRRTPEGIYFLRAKLTQPEIPFSKYGSQAFTTDYPNYFDYKQKHTGDGIWLHAIPDEVALNRGSRGCVVVRNNVIKLLEPYIQLATTPIVIKDKINFVSKAEHLKMKSHMNSLLDAWREAWQSQNMDQYLSYYHEEFTAPGFKNLDKWKKHKLGLKEKYKFVKVSLSDALILKHKNQYIIKARQDYESDLHKDSGLKTLYFVEDSSGKIKILREEWLEIPVNPQPASTSSPETVSPSSIKKGEAAALAEPVDGKRNPSAKRE